MHGGASRTKNRLLSLVISSRQIGRHGLTTNLAHISLKSSVPIAALLLDDPIKLSALGAVCALLEHALPEREPQDAIYEPQQLAYSRSCILPQR